MHRFLHIIPILILSVILTGCSLLFPDLRSVAPSNSPTVAEVPTDAIVLVSQAPSPAPTATPTSTPSPSPSPSPSPTPSPTPKGLLGGKYDVFSYGESPIVEDLSYQSDQLSIRISEYTYPAHDPENPYTKKSLRYYVADVYLQDLSSLRTASADQSFGPKSDRIETIAKREDALFAVNGDYYIGNKNTLIIRNGKAYRLKTIEQRDVCILFRDGSVKTYLAADLNLKELDVSAIWQAWEFGPYLIEPDGSPRKKFANSKILTDNPRTAFGYFEPGHYCFVVIDGRQSSYSMGVTLEALAVMMADLGCKQAFNLDGGATTQLYWQGGVYNRPCGNRTQSDIIYLVEPVGDAEPSTDFQEAP